MTDWSEIAQLVTEAALLTQTQGFVLSAARPSDKWALQGVFLSQVKRRMKQFGLFFLCK